jgi:outer membrane receptor protein involved in Fe transport
VARPQLLEFAPFGFSDSFGGYRVIGNPALVNTRIWNGDLRFEWFPTLREVIAASVFVKRFVDPIEQVLKAGSGNSLITYQNAEGADLIGGELEARKDLGFISDVLEPLSFVANLTLAFSEVTIDLTTPEAQNLTSTTRRMTNQAPWVVNLTLDYTNDDSGTKVRLLYNVAGQRIVTVGEKPIPDIYEQPRHVLDATAAQELFDGFDLKLSAKNILNAEHKYTYGPNDEEQTLRRQWRDGISFSLGASYTY